jgi:hypothetical protein
MKSELPLGVPQLYIRQIMNRGESIISWSEPDTWRQAALAHAKEEGKATFPWATWIVVLGLVAGVITWEWSDADTAKRVSVPILIGIILALCGFFIAIAWMHVRLNRRTTTTLHERGLLHGSLNRRRWIPWSEIDSFYLDEDAIGQQKFRFLTWTRSGADDEEFSVLPDDVDSDVVVSIFKNNKVEQAGTGQPATRPESKSEGSDKPQPEAEERSR